MTEVQPTAGRRRPRIGDRPRDLRLGHEYVTPLIVTGVSVAMVTCTLDKGNGETGGLIARWLDQVAPWVETPDSTDEFTDAA